MSRYTFIVAQDKPELCEYLTGWFSELSHVRVVLDRRQGERRKPAQVNDGDRRRSDRRSRPTLDAEIRQTGFAIIMGEQD